MQETNLTEMAQDHPGFERAVELAIGEHEEMSMRFVSRSSSASTKTNLSLPPKSTSPRPPTGLFIASPKESLGLSNY